MKSVCGVLGGREGKGVEGGMSEGVRSIERGYVEGVSG
jgi:hypothetical protein